MIQNRYINTPDLNHIYIVDTADDNIERRMLREAVVAKVTVSEEGVLNFEYSVAGKSNLMKVQPANTFYSVEEYKSNTFPKARFLQINQLLELLGIPDYFMDVSRAYFTISPKGYYISEGSIVAPLDFPKKWEFTREITLTETGGISLSAWRHNAPWHDQDIYLAREDALKNHKLSIQRLSGRIENV